MSCIQYAVQVTMSNIVRSICLPPMSESCRRLSCVELFCSELFVPSERIRAIGQGDCIVFCAIPLILLIVVEIKYLRML